MVYGAIVTLGATAALAYLVFYAARESVSALRSAVKTLAVGALAVAAAYGGAPVLLVVALSLGAAGDFLLSRPLGFLAGLVAFALAHLIYLALILGGPMVSAPGRIVAAVVLLALVVGLGPRLFRNAGPLRGPVAAYVGVIAAMGLAAVFHADPRVGLAAGLFIASDALLGAQLFLGLGRAWVGPALWTLYWLAQAGFLWAFG